MREHARHGIRLARNAEMGLSALIVRADEGVLSGLKDLVDNLQHSATAYKQLRSLANAPRVRPLTIYVLNSDARSIPCADW
jgi:hypothetical protein